MLGKKTSAPPLPQSQPESNGIEIKVKLSESTLVKLIPLVIAVLVGSGVLVHTQSVPLPTDSHTENNIGT